ncbi:MAG: F0F1 ATP synthase subunit beta, partial [Erysipelotrichaceae bacterium]|nr:F0F1 ATP synthase subunit beta [Erysipelotrichaceae bacterium]
MEANYGEIVQIIGPVIDIRYSRKLPKLYNAINIPFEGGMITAEVEQHIGNDKVRCIALTSTDGLVRGMEAIDTGEPIKVPVGREVLGRMFNLLGEPIDGLGPVNTGHKDAIHKAAPTFEDQKTEVEIMETG